MQWGGDGPSLYSFIIERSPSRRLRKGHVSHFVPSGTAKHIAEVPKPLADVARTSGPVCSSAFLDSGYVGNRWEQGQPVVAYEA